MAVQAFALPDKYSESSKNSGKGVASYTKTIAVLAADDDTSVYVVGYIPAGALISRIGICNSAITNGTDYNLGIYDKDGVVVDDNYFLDAGNLSGAHASGAELTGLTAFPIADKGRALYLGLGKTLQTKDEGYYIVLTGVTVGTVDGTIVITVEYIN